MVTKSVQTTFSSGEISEEALNRVDLDFYEKSLKIAENVYINSIGNAVKRSGSEMVAGNVPYVRLEAFSFNGFQNYIMAFYDRKIDVYRDGLKTATINIPHNVRQIMELDYTQQSDTVILFHQDVPATRILRKSSSEWEVSTVLFKNIPTYAFGKITETNQDTTLEYSTTQKKTKITLGKALASDSWVGQKIYLNKGGALDIYKVSSPTVVWGNWRISPPDTEKVLANEWQLATGFEPIFRPYSSKGWRHTETGEVVYSLSATPKVNDYVYYDSSLNVERRRIIQGLTGGGDDTIYTESTYKREPKEDFEYGIIILPAFKSPIDGEIVGYWEHGDPEPLVFLKKADGNHPVLGTVISNDGTTLKAKVEYQRYAQEDHEGGSNPSTGCFGKGRLFLGGIKGFESALLASQADDFFNFDLGYGEDGDAILYQVDTHNPIRHLTFSQTLLINTPNSEHFLEYTSSGIITPKSFNVIQSSSHGTSVKPFDIDGITAFVEKSGCIVRSFVYDDVQRNYNAENLSVLSPHLIKVVRRVAVKKSSETNPNNVAYLLNEDGTITLFNLLREQKFKAFSRCITNGKYKDVCAVSDEVYCLCDRIVNGKTVRFLEHFSKECDLDCSIKRYSDSRKTTWDGLGFFNEQEVDVIGDTYFYSGKFTPHDGKIIGVVGLQGEQLDFLGREDGFKQVEVGFGYIVNVTPAPIEYRKYDQITSFGDIKRLVYVNTKCIDTLGILIETLGHKYVTNYLKLGKDTLNDKLNLETGFKKVYCGGYSDELTLTITQEFPAKFNLVAIDIGVE